MPKLRKNMFTNHKLSEMVKFSVGLREGRKDPKKWVFYGKIASKGGATKWSLMSGHVSLTQPSPIEQENQQPPEALQPSDPVLVIFDSYRTMIMQPLIRCY